MLIQTRVKLKVSILIGLSIILMYFRVNIPIFPGFLDYDLSDIPILFIGLYFSPLFGVLGLFIKNLLVCFIIGSFTFGIGELASFLMVTPFILVGSILFRKLEGRKKYLVSYLCSSLSLIVSAVMLNYFVILPLYSKILNLNILEIIEGRSILGFLAFVIVPYNIIKSIIVFIPTVIIYDKIKNSRIIS